MLPQVALDRQSFASARIVRFAVEREAQIVLDVIVTRINERRHRQLCKLFRERPVALRRVAAVVAVPGAQTPVHAGDRVLRILVREDFRAHLPDHGLVAARVVALLVRVEDLGDRARP